MSNVFKCFVKNYVIVYFYRIAQKRGDAVSREVLKKVADDKRMTKQEKDER